MNELAQQCVGGFSRLPVGGAIAVAEDEWAVA